MLERMIRHKYFFHIVAILVILSAAVFLIIFN